MIAVFGGASEGGDIASGLAQEGIDCALFVTTDAGDEFFRARFKGSSGAPDSTLVVVGALDGARLLNVLVGEKFTAVIDATHPFATEISKNLRCACASVDVPLLRLDREPTEIREGSDVRIAADYREAARLASSFNGSIFLTIGSRRLEEFVAEFSGAVQRLVARVLSEPSSLEACLAARIPRSNIIAAVGPFSVEFNMACIRERMCEVLVTKDSGARGGTPEKLEAAARLDIPVVMVRRPGFDKNGVTSVAAALKWGFTHASC